ncbi:unnamed protein product [Didymodactylos carnosus]|uniref:Inosine/uridine-preferring nucleoside hydrolase domain-containing protein n=1 Tax=Didymodactylos carnosus TaxID=1234261 RepID=A0A8S2TAN9_9BILA|nr:unnamed protein product [Didymodactylos carnosus]CAF4280011.1 unnamed protein product [Didymodactylos carnosus]
MARNKKIKLVIDTDPGIDDFHAITMALSSPNIDVLALTCVTGNTSLSNGVRNVHYLLQTLNRTDVPVYKGAECSVTGKYKYASHVHGDDGCGNATIGLNIELNLLQDEPAAMALCRLAKQYHGELVVAAIGPLTNLFLAHRLDPEFSKHLKELYIMGGNSVLPNYQTLSIGIEFNFRCDPLAASIVHIMPLIISYELTCICSLSYDYIDSLFARKNESKKAKLFHSVSEFLYDFSKTDEQGSGFNSCDSVAMACVLDKSMILETRKVYAVVEQFGSCAAGHMISDWHNHFKRQPNVEIVENIDFEKFKKLFLLCVDDNLVEN